MSPMLYSMRALLPGRLVCCFGWVRRQDISLFYICLGCDIRWSWFMMSYCLLGLPRAPFCLRSGGTQNCRGYGFQIMRSMMLMYWLLISLGLVLFVQFARVVQFDGPRITWESPVNHTCRLSRIRHMTPEFTGLYFVCSLHRNPSYRFITYWDEELLKLFPNPNNSAFTLKRAALRRRIINTQHCFLYIVCGIIPI